MVVMVPLYVITAAFAGPAACAEYAGNTNFIVHAFLQGMQFVVGVYVLMTGVPYVFGLRSFLHSREFL